jgi:rSAM/selenodomain-associated transferase 1
MKTTGIDPFKMAGFKFPVTHRLLIFVKAPRPGRVKTRLAETLGPNAACRAYCRMVDRLLSRLAGLDPVQLCFAPDDAAQEIRPWLQPNWRSTPQGPGDLGQRLERAFLDTFASGAQRVVVIGSDCPYVTAEDIETAWSALRDHDMVIGPAEDGGYWLLGLTANQPSLFQAIPWSSDRVFRETMIEAEKLGLKVHTLRTLADLDTAAEWETFLKRSGTCDRLPEMR